MNASPAAPAVSIIIPVYNVAPALEACLRSALEQSLEDIEVIAIDDGSTDDSGSMLDAYAARDRRLHVVHQANAGVSSARNRGLDEARGAYVAFLDGDDRLGNDFCRLLYEQAISAQLPIVKGLRVTRCLDGSLFPVPQLNAALHSHSSPLYFCAQWITALYARRLLLEHTIRFSATLRYSEDLLFLCQAVACCARIGVDDRAEYFYCRRPGSADSGPLSSAQVSDACSVCTAVSRILCQLLPNADAGGVAYFWQRLLKLLSYVEHQAASIHDKQRTRSLALELLHSCPVPHELRLLRQQAHNPKPMMRTVPARTGRRPW